jgi:hypothetical protein
MIPSARLTILFDCCHSGSAVELPYVYRPNSRGEVNLIDNVKQGINLAHAAMNLVRMYFCFPYFFYFFIVFGRSS